MFSALLEFGWNPIMEKNNVIGLNKGGKNITLKPGNQIEFLGKNSIIFMKIVLKLTTIYLNLNK